MTAIAMDRLLNAANAAADRNDAEAAHALFKQHLRNARKDVAGLAYYGMFNLRAGKPEIAGFLMHRASHLAPGDDDLRHQLGYAQLRNGDYSAARDAFAAILAQTSDDALALNGIGLCHAHANEFVDAIAAFERAVAAQPDNVAVLINLADAYRRSGATEAAITTFGKIRQRAPQHTPTLIEYAASLREAGFPPRALEVLSAIPAPDRQQPGVLLELARCRRQMGQLAEAIGLLHELNRQVPETAQCHEEMGHCLTAIGERPLRLAHWQAAASKWIDAADFSRADPLLEALLSEDPDNAAVWNLRGMSQELQQQIAAAEASFAKAIDVDRHCLAAYANLATLLEETNRVDEARKITDAGLQLGVDFPEFSRHAHLELRVLSCKIARRQKQFDTALARLDALSGQPLSDKQEEFVRFERGLVLDQLDRPAAAMTAFVTANHAVRARWVQTFPGPNQFLAEIADMTEFANRGGLAFGPTPEVARTRPDPVFLVGFPRSGTTLLNQIIDGNSAVQTVEEKPTVGKLFDLITAMPEGYPAALSAFDAIDVEYLRRVYFNAVAQHLTLDDSKVFVDKFPLHIVKIGLIHRVFPQARFIFSARHPCDVILSCFMQNFRPNHAMANFFTLADAVTLYLRTMELWQLYQDKLPIQVHTVRYDAMVDDVEGESKKVCDFLGVPWQPEQTDFVANALRRGKINTPSYAQVSQPIYRGALHRWEKYREYFEPHLPALQLYIERYG